MLVLYELEASWTTTSFMSISICFSSIIIIKIMIKRKLSVYYDWSSPPSRAVMMFFKHVLRPEDYTTVELRLSKNEHKTPEYRKINPVQQIPVILET